MENQGFNGLVFFLGLRVLRVRSYWVLLGENCFFINGRGGGIFFEGCVEEGNFIRIGF